MFKRREPKPDPVSLKSLLDDLERGQSPNKIGRAANAYFENDMTKIAEEMLFETSKNLRAQTYHGHFGGRIVEGKQLPDGRRNWWLEGGTPIGISDDRHACLIAGSRAGKGRSVLVPNLLTYPRHGSILSLDPKGDHARITASYRAKLLGQRVVVIDPFGVSGEETLPYRAGFNPLGMVTEASPDLAWSNALLIADALVVPGNESSEHWDNTSRHMIGAGLILHVATAPQYEGRRTLVTVLDLATRADEPDPNDSQLFRLEVEMKSNTACEGAIQAAAQAFYSRSGGEFSGVLSSVRKHLDWIGSPIIKPVLASESIDLRDLKRDSLAVYVCVPAMRMSELAGWMRLLVQLTLAACEQVNSTTSRPPLLMVLDEAHVLGKLRSLELSAALLAGFGVKLWFVLQDLGQLKVYRNWETILGNCGTVQAFGNVDLSTLDYLAKQLGSTQIATTSHSSQAYGAAAQSGVRGESWSTTSHPLMAPDEIARVFGRDDHLLRQLVLRPGHRPLILQRAFYDKHELFRGKTTRKSA